MDANTLAYCINFNLVYLCFVSYPIFSSFTFSFLNIIFYFYFLLDFLLIFLSLPLELKIIKTLIH